MEHWDSKTLHLCTGAEVIIVAEEAYFADSKRDGDASASFENTFGSSIASSSPEFEVTSSDDLPF